MIQLDGISGGGQILRTALALSALTQQPFSMKNIRANRRDPGLKPQHYTGVKAVQDFTHAKTDAQLGATELTFIPQTYAPRTTTIDIGTAGSITLLMQSLLLPSLFCNKPHTLTITGGTDTAWSMPIDYYTHVLLPHYRPYADITLNILKRGYYPKGGGTIKIQFKPILSDSREDIMEILRKKQYTSTEQGHLIRIQGISHASKDLEHAQVAERQANAAQQYLHQYDVEIQRQYQNTLSKGSGITLWATFSQDKDEIDPFKPIIIGADELGKQGIPSETIGTHAAEKLKQAIEQHVPFDHHAADNLIPLLGLLGKARIKTTEITDHIRTNISVTEQFLPCTFTIDGTTITATRA